METPPITFRKLQTAERFYLSKNPKPKTNWSQGLSTILHSNFMLFRNFSDFDLKILAFELLKERSQKSPFLGPNPHFFGFFFIGSAPRTQATSRSPTPLGLNSQSNFYCDLIQSGDLSLSFYLISFKFWLYRAWLKRDLLSCFFFLMQTWEVPANWIQWSTSFQQRIRTFIFMESFNWRIWDDKTRLKYYFFIYFISLKKLLNYFVKCIMTLKC